MNRKKARAFTLVEVTLALGLAGFCLATLIGLMPVALSTLRSSRDRAAATNCVELIVSSLRQGTIVSSGDPAGGPYPKFTSSGVYTQFNWRTSDTSVPPFTLSNISAAGTPTANAADDRLNAYVQVLPPANASANAPTSVRISVAWPSAATYNATTQQWEHANGVISTYLVFEPGQ